MFFLLRGNCYKQCKSFPGYFLNSYKQNIDKNQQLIQCRKP